MRVVIIAAECEPWAKTGGLGDVVDALARALGVVEGGPTEPVDVFLPRYRTVPLPGSATTGRTIRVPDPLARGGASNVRIVDVAADGYRLRLIDHPPAFDRDGFYGPPSGGDFPDNAWRFGLLCRAALEALRADGRPVDVISIHDWHAGPTVLFRDLVYADDPVVGRAAIAITLHNLAYHGWVPAARVAQLGLRVGALPGAAADGIDLLAAGIRGAELANTVSPGFAAEALTEQFGMGLDGLLREKGDRFVGILNGLDTRLWDPAGDGVLAAPYSRADRTGKAACRADLLERNGLEPADDGPVIGAIGRLDPQKGFDLIAGMTRRLVAAGGRLIVQGSGDVAIAEPFRRAAARWPDRVALVERFDRAMARRIYAGADFFAMPSRFEPCGQGQMIALRYGTPPIVRRTGGLADTVLDVDEHPGAGTGFVFDEPTAAGLLAACARAIALRERGGPGWAALLDRGMAVDFDWRSSSAPRYVRLFERAIALRRRAGARPGPEAPARQRAGSTTGRTTGRMTGRTTEPTSR